MAAQENSAGVGNPLEVTSSVFRRDDGSGAPGEAVAQFYPSDRHQHFEVSVRGIAENSIVHWDFSALDTSVGPRDKIASVERRIPPLGGASEVLLNGAVALPRDWPVGRYRATVAVNGALVRMLDYTVVAPPTPTPAPPRVTKLLFLSDDGKGAENVEVKKFSPADRKMHFRAELSSAYTGKVRWRFIAVATASGSNIPLLELNGDVTKVTHLVAQMAAPKDWPVGEYRGEVYLGEDLLHSFDFVVSAS